MKHTKGKWALTGRDANGAVNVFTDAEFIATVRHEYDAKLIAAAPEMYKALKQAQAGIGDWRGVIDLALSKAEV